MADQKRPNILYIMADQMAAPMLPMYNDRSVIKTPNLSKLASEGVVFDSAYCNSPLCAPSRFAMVTGQLPSRTGGYDNASNLAGDIPTYAHYMRSQGYHTALSGKMHFVGPDQLHGFEERLTSDIYPGDYGWSVNWDESEIRPDWYHDMSSVLDAGPIIRTNQLDYDEEVVFKAQQYLYNHVRHRTDQPFSLTVSMTHPHDPYAMTAEYWDQYEDVDIPMPETAAIPHDQQDAHSQRVLKCVDLFGKEMPQASIRAARRAYFAACTYVDTQIGKILKTLEACGLKDDTIVVFSGDHGDMLGERGLWYKMVWFEMSARVPLLVHSPSRFSAKRVSESVSTMDLMPTFVEMIGSAVIPSLPLDGVSLMPYVRGECEGDATKRPDTVLGEYMGEGTVCPVIMIRRGKYKFVYATTDAPMLFDLEADPLELNNLAAGYNPEEQGGAAAMAALKLAAQTGQDISLSPPYNSAMNSARDYSFTNTSIPSDHDHHQYLHDHHDHHDAAPSSPIASSSSSNFSSSNPPMPFSLANFTPPASANPSPAIPCLPTLETKVLISSFLREVATRWDLEKVRRDVLESQRRRCLVFSALSAGVQTSWEYVTPVDISTQYHRNLGKVGQPLGSVETLARWPRKTAARVMSGEREGMIVGRRVGDD